MKEIFPGVYKEGRFLLTRNLVPKFQSCGEDLVKREGKEFRTWDPKRSKLAAAIKNGLKREPLRPGMKVLYLGIASGTTASYISDILGKNGIIYGIEFSDRVFKDLFEVAKKRGNIVPILADARKPNEYTWIETVDIIYEDVAQPDMLTILERNAELFLKKGGFLMIAIKARSIDVTKNPQVVYKEALKNMRKSFNVLEWIRLDPFEKDHCFIVAQKI